MPRKPRAFVLDSWAVLAYLGDEQTGQEVADIMANAQDQGTVLTMSIVNAGEVWYILARETSELEADGVVTNLRQLGIQLVDADWKLTRLCRGLQSQASDVLCRLLCRRARQGEQGGAADRG